VYREWVTTRVAFSIIMGSGVRLNIEDALLTEAWNFQAPSSKGKSTRTRRHNAKFSVSGFHCSAIDDVLLLGGQRESCLRKAPN
jgi:hypothetical protein